MASRRAVMVGVAGWALMAGLPAIAQDIAPLPTETTAPAQPVTTLSEALVLAYGRDPDLLAERSNVRASDQRLVQARAAFGPNLSVSGRYGYLSRLEKTPASPIPRTLNKGFSGTASLILNQPLFTSGRLAAGVEVGRAQRDFQLENLRFAEQNALLDVINSYVSVRRDRDLLTIANDNLALLDRQFSESDTRFKVREITRTDLDQVVTRVELGRATVQSSRNALGTSNSQFIQTVGAAPGDLQALPPLPNLPATLEEAHEAIETANPLVLAARARERASRAQVNQIRAQTGPDVSLRGEASYGDLEGVDFERRQRDLRGEVVLNMPLYTSGQLSAQVREAKEINDSDWRLIDSALREARFSADQAWNQLLTARASLTSLENSVAAAQRAYDGAVVQLRTGARTTLDVLDLARDLLDARSQLVSARAIEYAAGANLLAAMGRLELADLEPTVPQIDPLPYVLDGDRRGETPIISDLPRIIDGLAAAIEREERQSRDEQAALMAEPIGTMPPPPAQTGP